MRELVGRSMRTRVKGRPALVRRLTALLVATQRFGVLRASTDDDRRWAAKVIDALVTALGVARGELAGGDEAEGRS